MTCEITFHVTCHNSRSLWSVSAVGLPATLCAYIQPCLHIESVWIVKNEGFSVSPFKKTEFCEKGKAARFYLFYGRLGSFLKEFP